MLSALLWTVVLWTVGFVIMPVWKKIKVIIELSYSKFWSRKVLKREVVQSVEGPTGLAVVAFPLGRLATFLLKSRGIFPNKKELDTKSFI